MGEGEDNNGRTLIWKHICVFLNLCSQWLHTQSEDAIEAVQLETIRHSEGQDKADANQRCTGGVDHACGRE
jgi:hypothetical protein